MEHDRPTPELDIEALRRNLDNPAYMNEAIEVLARDLSAELLDQYHDSEPHLS